MNVRWAPRMDHDLLQRMTEEEHLSDAVMVCRADEIDGRTRRRFGLFESVDQLESYIKSRSNLSLFEVILGSRSQKFYVDVDIGIKDVEKGTPDGSDKAAPGKGSFESIPADIAHRIGKEICRVVGELCDDKSKVPTEEDVYIYSSHGATKLSFHLVLQGYHVNSHKISAMICKRVIEGLGKDSVYGRHIDEHVYKSTQQLRVLWTSKVGADRPKVVERGTDCLRTSLITCVEDSVPVGGSYRPPPIRKTMDAFEGVNGEVARDMVQEFLQVSGQDIRTVMGNLVLLNRHKSSFCPICKRVHDNDSGYIIVGSSYIHYYCRRSPETPMQIQNATYVLTRD